MNNYHLKYTLKIEEKEAKDKVILFISNRRRRKKKRTIHDDDDDYPFNHYDYFN